jgi:hypothetical protein
MKPFSSQAKVSRCVIVLHFSAPVVSDIRGGAFSRLFEVRSLTAGAARIVSFTHTALQQTKPEEKLCVVR